MPAPAKLKHDCCRNATAYLVADRRADRRAFASYRWKLRLSPRAGHYILTIFCPWCGVNLETWRAEHQQARAEPTLSLVEPLS